MMLPSLANAVSEYVDNSLCIPKGAGKFPNRHPFQLEPY